VSIFRVTPLLVFPLLFFVLVAAAAGETWTTSTFMTFDMYSGARWTMTNGDAFVTASLFVLFVEIVKSVNTESNEILNHGLSMLVALACVIFFVTSASYGNTAFFLLTAMTIIDVIAGFIITIMTARRDFGAAAH
jgi:hypothetical protein